MRRVAIYSAGIMAIIFALYALADEMLIFFIAGKIPFTKLAVPAIIMLLVWTFFVPLTLFLLKISALSFWQILEHIGFFHQRLLNQRTRLFTPKIGVEIYATFTAIMVAVTIEDLEEDKTTFVPVRRRFVALPY